MSAHSNIEIESMAIMAGQPEGAAFRKACQAFEIWWANGVKNQPRGRFVNEQVEETCKNIARLAFLEGRGL